MKTKTCVAKEITLAQLNSIPVLVDYAIDAATSGPMTTKFGSHAIYSLKAQYGETMLAAAWELIGKPLKDRLDVHNRAMDKIVKDWRVKIAHHTAGVLE